MTGMWSGRIEHTGWCVSVTEAFLMWCAQMIAAAPPQH
eukprot:COSAG01_NODE_17136_length_1175_cov_1.390335_3_plen_37_part_01